MAVSLISTGVQFPDNSVQTSAAGLTSYYQSSELTIASTSTFSVSHGLGVTPKLIMPSLICKTADRGYSVNDEIYMLGYTDIPGQTLFTWRANSTTITLKCNGNLAARIVNLSTAAVEYITVGSWRLIIRAYK